MKPILALFVALVALNRPAYADYTIVEKMERTGAAPQDVTIRMKEGKARIDIGGMMSTISSAGEIKMLMHTQKMVVKMPLLALARKAKQTEGAKSARLEPTGRKEKINGFDTEEYTHEIPALKTTGHYWITKDVPDAVEILKMMGALEGTTAKQFMQAAGAVLPEDYPGLPIRTETDSDILGKPEKMTVTIVSIKKEPVDDSVFVVPPDYKETGMPGIPGERPSTPH